jgi:hypothetical protein
MERALRRRRVARTAAQREFAVSIDDTPGRSRVGIDLEVARALLANPDIGVTQIAHRRSVSAATLYRYIPAARNREYARRGFRMKRRVGQPAIREGEAHARH